MVTQGVEIFPGCHANNIRIHDNKLKFIERQDGVLDLLLVSGIQFWSV